MDGPVPALCGAVVMAAWSYGLVRDTSAVFLDMNPDRNSGAYVGDQRDRWGSIDRCTLVASRARSLGGNHLCCHTAAARA